MKLRRTREDWQRLIEQQKTSGLSIVGFCKQNKLPTSNFYKYRNRLQASEQAPTLVKVKSQAFTSVKSSITLTHGNTQLSLPSRCEPQWLADLIKALNT